MLLNILVSEYIQVWDTRLSVDNKEGEMKSVVFKFLLIAEPLHWKKPYSED